MSPCVYVVIPIYNVEKYLRECIESVLSQSYLNLRLILVNDGSTDGSGEIARSYLSDSRVALITQENKGLSAARNAGMHKAMKESLYGDDILIFLDSDDALNKTYVQSIVCAFFRNPKVQVLVGGVQMMSEDGELLKKSEDRDENLYMSGLEYLVGMKGDYFSFSWGGGGYKMHFLRSKKFQFIEGIINEDLAFGFEVFTNAQVIGFFNDWIFYRQREGSLSCAKTFLKHSNTLLFHSYKTNCDYLLSLLQKKRLRLIYPLVRRCLVSCASMPFWCWLKDRSLCERDELLPLIPYVGWKKKSAFYLPSLARIWMKIFATRR